MIRQLLAAATAGLLLVAGLAGPATAMETDAPVLTSFARVGDDRDLAPGKVAEFSYTLAGATAAREVGARFVSDDGGRLSARGDVTTGHVRLDNGYRTSSGTYRLEHVVVWHLGVATYYYPDGSVVRDGVTQPDRHEVDLAGIAVNYVDPVGDSRVPVITSLRRLSTLPDHPTATQVHLRHVTEEQNLESIIVRYSGPDGRAFTIYDWGYGSFQSVLEPGLPLGRYTAVRVEARDTFGALAVYLPDGTVEKSSRFSSYPAGPDRHSIDFAALSFNHVPAPARPASIDSSQRGWIGVGDPSLIARTPDGRLRIFWLSGSYLAGGFQIGRGWSGMGPLTQVRNLSGTGVNEIAAIEQSTGRLFSYPAGGWMAFGNRRQIGRGWNGMDMLVGVQSWTGPGSSGLMARKAATGELYYYGADGRGGLRPGVVIGRGWSGMDAIFAAGDWDVDGKVDIIGRQRATGELHLYLGNGSGRFLGSRMLSSGWSQYEDFTGAVGWSNGQLGFLARDRSTGEVWMFDTAAAEGWWEGSRYRYGHGFTGYTLIS